MKKLFLFILLLIGCAALAQPIPVKFFKLIPVGYDAKNAAVPQFADLLPEMVLPEGKVYHKTVTRQGWTTPQIMKAGITHWGRFSVQKEGGEGFFRNDPYYKVREYNAAPRTQDIFNLSPDGPDRHVDGVNRAWWKQWPLSDKQIIDLANNVDISSRLWVGENMEGPAFIWESDRLWRVFYSRLRERFEEQYKRDGIPYLLCHNYFSRLPTLYGLGWDDRHKQEALYTTHPDQWPLKTSYHDNLRATNLVVEAIYPGHPDDSPRSMYSKIMAMELWSKMGYKTGLFLFYQHEWHPGFVSSHTYNDGTFYRKDKLVQDPNALITWPFLALEFGDCYFDWGLGGRTPADMKPIGYYEGVHRGADWWLPTNGTLTQDFPYYDYKTPNRQTVAYLGQYAGDMSHFGVWLWNSTAGRVAGGEAKYCSYRIDGGSWIEATENGTDVIRAYHEPNGLHKGIVRARRKGDGLMFWYLNSYADNRKHTREVRNPWNPTQTYSATVAGSGIHATLIQ